MSDVGTFTIVGADLSKTEAVELRFPALNITPKQRRVLDFIQSYMGEHRCSPSVRDIMQGVGLKSTGNAFRYLLALEERGAIARPPSKARAIEVIRP